MLEIRIDFEDKTLEQGHAVMRQAAELISRLPRWFDDYKISLAVIKSN